ncbi:uroporphyrinogen-III synthase HemD family protein [Chlamydia psittaci 09DC78]|uniref:uroporphyrinogen-III synthase n=1 Tax=Chlamydia psittaci TaxID=83554 RepID=UPI00035447DA|nr:uroporphyrinogen-III synthase [Chlamydia psittaci]EPJ25401.1 uroporphyrinogen-III synthase HemD family protein [Chlamydia psittaci 09DC77]EPJ26680.1 uroporphyrinogen-III synthase HemD family protein [Chlamydia psittaci 09DC80]EPJ30560.1 uroporphyrinogen-III synthase HemD family protein [Chlamydia psittaci 09DC78]EPL01598.1 uroporphyrinogen-III synthase HemD family protein [Chlamydia psittaci 09DC79]
MTIYLGLNRETANRYHASFVPILEIIPFARSSPQLRYALRYLEETSHILLTSPSSTSLFISRMRRKNSKKTLSTKHYLCLGEITASRLTRLLPKAQYSLATIETGEGVLPMISSLPKNARILYPHSALSRSVIEDFLKRENRSFFAYSHYTIRERQLHPSVFKQCSRVILTSPSGVRAYAKLFPQLPRRIHICQGPITLKEFREIYNHPGELLQKDSLTES